VLFGVQFFHCDFDFFSFLIRHQIRLNTGGPRLSVANEDELVGMTENHGIPHLKTWVS
jgi:hypothetical protein